MPLPISLSSAQKIPLYLNCVSMYIWQKVLDLTWQWLVPTKTSPRNLWAGDRVICSWLTEACREKDKLPPLWCLGNVPARKPWVRAFMWMSLWPCTHRNDHGLSWWQWSAKVQKMSRRSCRNMTKSSKYWLDLQIHQRSGHDLQNALEGLQWRSAPSKSVVMVLCWKTVDWPLQNYRRIGAQSTWYGRYTWLMTRQLSNEVKLSIYHFIQAPTVTLR